MSSHLRNEILAACVAGDLARVQELYGKITLAPGEQAVLLAAMTLKGAENDHAEIVRFCLERGAKPEYEVINEASEFPEVFKVLVTVGGLDVNYDFEIAGDMLINAVWELKVCPTSNPTRGGGDIRKKKKEEKNRKRMRMKKVK